MVNLVSVLFFILSFSISDIYCVQMFIISETTVIIVIYFLVERAESIFAIMDSTFWGVISFLNIFSRIRRMTLNC